ncbi:MAG TPA: hypothetical protein VII63_03800 [Caulobacteraceae bacterium]
MNWVGPIRACLGVAIIAAAVAFPAIESSARSKKPPPEVIVPPPPPPPGPVVLPDRLLADAAAYEAYLLRASSISPGFQNGASVAQALSVGVAYEPKSLIRGAVTYGAVAALQAPAFVADLRAAGATPEARRQMVNDLIGNAAYVFVFKGSDTAAGLAEQALGAPALHLYAAGKAVKQSAYDVQHQAWSRDEIVDRTGRLAAAKALSARPSDPAMEQVAVLRQAASGAAPMAISSGPAPPPYTPLVARALQLAAVAAIGEAGDDAYDRLTYLTDENNTEACLSMAKLNLFQCLAVSKPHYEDIFCVGQHIMQDTGACLAKNAGVAMPMEAPPLAATPAPPVRATTHPSVRRRG